VEPEPPFPPARPEWDHGGAVAAMRVLNRTVTPLHGHPDLLVAPSFGPTHRIHIQLRFNPIDGGWPPAGRRCAMLFPERYHITLVDVISVQGITADEINAILLRLQPLVQHFLDAWRNKPPRVFMLDKVKDWSVWSMNFALTSAADEAWVDMIMLFINAHCLIPVLGEGDGANGITYVYPPVRHISWS